MGEIQYFDRISIAPPLARIYRRLGYRKGMTSLHPQEKLDTERSIDIAASLIRLRGAARRLPMVREGASTIRLKDLAVFKSRRLSQLLLECDEILLMGVTAGSEIVTAIQENAAGPDIRQGVILDAAASETVDAALDWIMTYFNQILRREGKRLLAMRYSAGYGDLALENQEAMHRLLALESIGVAINPSCILIPEKSVTAMTGITRSPAMRKSVFQHNGEG